MSARLPRQFFARPTLRVARELLGCVVAVRHGSRVQRGLVVETEAYVGPRDLASHAARGRTPRTEVMFGGPGHLYVYLIYGMHHCVNVVTERVGYPAAVLIRGLVPVVNQARFYNVSKMVRPDQNKPSPVRAVTGPGRVCRHLGITRRLNREDVVAGGRVWFERGVRVPLGYVHQYPRVGIAYAGRWQHKPWRFVLELGDKK